MISPSKKINSIKKKTKNIYSLIGFYNLERRSLEEIATNGISLESSQIVPLSIGLKFKMENRESKFSYSTQMNINYISGKPSGVENPPSTPPEYQANLISKYRIGRSNFKVLAGLEFDTISLYNTFELKNNSIPVESKSISGLYGLIGVEQKFYILDIPSVIQLKYSKSISLSNNISNISDINSLKASVFFGIHITRRIQLHTYLSNYTMTGDSKIDMTKLSLGIGYLFF